MNWGIPSFEMGYWLRRTERESGFMTEAINALTRYAILVFHAKRIEIRC
jgi:ribosomal-protein-serine acetyltransferase